MFAMHFSAGVGNSKEILQNKIAQFPSMWCQLGLISKKLVLETNFKGIRKTEILFTDSNVTWFYKISNPMIV